MPQDIHVFRARFRTDTAARIQEKIDAVTEHPRWTERSEADIIRAALIVGIMTLAKSPAKAYERAVEELAGEPEPSAYQKRAPGRPRGRTA